MPNLTTYMNKRPLILITSLAAAFFVSLAWLQPWKTESSHSEGVSAADTPSYAVEVSGDERSSPVADVSGATAGTERARSGERNRRPVSQVSRERLDERNEEHVPGFEQVRYDSVLFEETTPPDARGRFERVRVVETDFHYPHLRITEHLETDSESGEVIRNGWHGMIADHVIARIDPSLTNDEVEALFPGEEIRVRRRMEEQGLFLLEFPLERIDAVESAIARISREAGVVEYVEPDQLVTPAAIDPPRDPRFDELWGLHNTGQAGFFFDVFRDPFFGDFNFLNFGEGREGADIDALRGWEIRTDASDIVVAVLDTGVNFNHEDLRRNMWRNSREIADGRDTSGNGFVDDIFGVDVTTGGPPMDDHGHGTHVAGTIGAVGDNGVGITGVAWDVQLMAVRFLVPFGTISDAVISFDYARSNGADIVNASFGGFFFSRAEKEAIQRLRNAGITVVAAAGNGGKNIDIFESSYPANYDLDNIVRVGASDRRDQPAFFSNHGPERVHIFAPGVDILSTSVPFAIDPFFELFVPQRNDSFYEYMDGTSMAAPHVAGIMALIAAEYPGEDYRTLINRLLAGARIEEEFLGEFVREGRFANLFGPLSQGDSPILFTGLHDVDFTEGDTITLSVDAAARPAPSYTWYRDGVLLVDNESEPLSGPAITLENMRENDAGIYEVVISNVPNPGPDDETVTSSARLRFNPGDPLLGIAVDAPELEWTTSEDRPWEAVSGGDGVRSYPGLGNNVTSKLIVNVHGPATISFDWRVSSERLYDFLRFRINGEVERSISGETGWEPITVHLSEARAYRLAWSYEKDFVGADGEDAGWIRNVDFTPHFPHILEQPRDREVVEGGTARFTVLADGNPNPQYRWYRDGERIDDATLRMLQVSGVDAADEGAYHAVVWNSHGSVRTIPAQLSVVSEANPPAIVNHPESVSAMPGDTVMFEVGYQGTSPIKVQWHKEGVGPIAGATGDRLFLADIDEDDAGAYFAEVGNSAGQATSLSAVLTFVTDKVTFDGFLKAMDAGSDEDVSSQLYRYATGSGRAPEASVSSGQSVGVANPALAQQVETMAGGDNYLGIKFDRARNAVGVSFHLEASDDLENWEEVPAVIGVIDVLDEDTERVLLREETPASNAGVRFLRLKIRHGAP